MTVIFLLDDNKGMLFNHRRLSRDAKIFEDIKTYLSGDLLVNEFSEKLVASFGLNYKIFSEFPLPENPESKNNAEFYLIENISVKKHLDKINRIIIYWWNRKYPSDFKLDFGLSEHGFCSVSAYSFAGKSHEKITREIFEK